MGPRGPEPARPSSPAGAVFVYSGSEVIGAGLAGLLPREWRERIELCSEIDQLERLLGERGGDVIVDADTPDVREALCIARSGGGSVVLLLGPSSPPLDPEVAEAADAIIRRDETDPVMLRISLAVGRAQMRLVPRDKPPPASGCNTAPGSSTLPEQSKRVLALLARGMRDAEIARELSLSESAVRKLVQRTVRIVGARTRSQAVAIAARSGRLTE